MKGPIQLGGMVTWLAYKIQYKNQLVGMEPVSYGSALNLEHLMNMKFIKETSIVALWLIRGTIWCRIPSRFMTEPPANTNNPWRVPFEEINDAELKPNEIEKRNQARHHQQQQQH